MKPTPKIIKNDINNIKASCEEWLNVVGSLGNECAFTDRLIEKILTQSKQLEKDYKKQFEN